MLALTASADIVSRDRVIKLLHMDNARQIIVSPNRKNIRLGLASAPRPQQHQCLDWIVDEVKARATSMTPIIIYCRSIPAVGEVYHHLKVELGEDLWMDKDKEHKTGWHVSFKNKTIQQGKCHKITQWTGKLQSCCGNNCTWNGP